MTNETDLTVLKEKVESPIALNKDKSATQLVIQEDDIDNISLTLYSQSNEKEKTKLQRQRDLSRRLEKRNNSEGPLDKLMSLRRSMKELKPSNLIESGEEHK